MSKQIGGNRNSVENWDFSDDKLYAPADTTAADCWYDYSSRVGFGFRSQPKAMVIGLMALGWQIAPEFSAKKMRNIMEATAYKYDASNKGGLINPAGFIKEVKRAKKEGTSYSVKKCEKYIYYDNDELLEWGKNPGLGIRELQSEGYTGKNAVVAYIDQPLGNKLHGELSNIDLHYNTDIVDKHGKSKEASMHGPSVLSLIAGKNIGVAPKATIYYYAVPQASRDHKDEADAIRIAIQQNKKLPKDKKIKVIGISDNIAKNPQEQKKNPQELKAAIAEAKKEGILVTLCGEYGCLKCENLKDVDDYRNYSIDGTDFHDNDLYVPTYRTTAKLVGGFEKPTLYSNSWASPYVVGLIAMGLQVNPELSASKLISIMKTTARHFERQKTGGIVNPRAYIQAVEKTVKNSGANDYRVFIFNSEKVTDKELTAIKSYATTLNTKKRVRYIDAANLKNAGEVYGALKQLREENIGKIIGIQIFGTDKDVPAFEVEEKVQMGSGIHEAETYKSDFFYSNLNNSVENLEGISVYKNFEEKIGIDFLPQWPVARLPITTGDYEAYFKKYNGYKKAAKTKFNRLVSFSSPIFASDNHSDDMGWFIKYRMDNKYHFIKSDKYSLYGNLKENFLFL